MDWINSAFAQISNYISVPYLLGFLLLSYLVKRYFGTLLQRITRFNWRGVYTVLILATLLAIPFLLFSNIGWIKVVFSYALGTSLHELFFRYIAKLFKK